MAVQIIPVFNSNMPSTLISVSYTALAHRYV